MSGAFEKIVVSDTTPLVFVCDHASNRVPDCVDGGSLGLPESDMARHIAFDIGARGVTQNLVKTMGGVAVLSRFSRLVIDPNRGEDDPTLVMKLYDGTIIPQNRQVDGAEVERRLDAFHRPYHQAIRDVLGMMKVKPILVSIHSFSPQLKGRAPRPWHIGVLSSEDRRIADPLLARLGQESDICVGDNEPYLGNLEGDCMAQHGLRRDLPHILIEIRNDLIADERGERVWASRLAPILREVFDDYHAKETANG